MEEQAIEQSPSRSLVALVIAGCAVNFWHFWLCAHSYIVLPDLWLADHHVFAAVALILMALVGRGRILGTGVGAGVGAGIGAGVAADVVAAVAGVAASIVICLGGELPAGVIVAQCCVSGLVLAWMQVRFFTLAIRCESVRAFSFVCLSSLAFSLVCLLTPLLATIGNEVLGVVAPVISAVALIGARQVPDQGPFVSHFGSSMRELTMGPYAAIVGLCFTYAAANILLKVNYGSFVYAANPRVVVTVVGNVLCGACSAWLYWSVARKKNTLDFFSLVKIPVALLAAALVAAGLFGSSPLLQIATFSSIWIIDLGFRALTIDVAQHSERDSHRIICLGLAAYMLAYYAGRCLFYAISSATSGAGAAAIALDEQLCFVLLGILVLTVVVSFRPHDHTASLLFRDINNEPVVTQLAEQETDRFEDACVRVAGQFGLSDREREVMTCIAKGYSKPFIAEMLYISDNTVRTYAKRIYEKTGVHSRRELQELIGL